MVLFLALIALLVTGIVWGACAMSSHYDAIDDEDGGMD